MSSMRNAVQRRNHKERAQPKEREKWGVLEKHKDYSLRAADYNAKKARLTILRRKAAERNPDEFYFGMYSSKTHDRGQKLADRGNEVLSQDAVKLLKTQDAGYLKTMVQQTRRAREKLERSFVLREGKSVEVRGRASRDGDTRKLFFVDNKEDQKSYHLSKQPDQGTLSETLDELSSEDNTRGEEQMPNSTKEQSKSQRIAETESNALRTARIARKKRKRIEEAQISRLKALKSREKDLLAADRELELQRAKMSNSIGGTNNAGIEGRTFIVSGGASGLGRATIRTLVAAGGNVSILDMNTEAGPNLIRELGADRAIFFETDVSKTDSIAAAVQGALGWAKRTGKEIGGVIAAAGVSSPAKIIDRHGEPLDITGFDFVMNINVRGSIDLVRQVVPHLSQVEPESPDGERGVIVLVSSSAAFDGQPGQVAYSASKGALASLTLPMTRDLARYGIRVVTIAPSLFDSGMTALMSDKVRASLTNVMEFPKRPGKPEEFARVVKEGVENSMLNGVVIRLDGGMRMPSKM
ncbi:hypothetical protein G7Y79_00035g071330 [Physcia stellaris]|nr:hypothetical protein G7Y79_00035g071330 [Physcia stellaris]